MSNTSTIDGEPEICSSSASFASDRDERNCGTESELSDNEREILQVARSEHSPEPDGEPPKRQTTILKRTPLPYSHIKHPALPPFSSKAPPTKRLRVVKSGTKWSDQEYASLKRLKNKGLSWQDISNQLPGRSVNACSRQYHRSLAIPPETSPNLSTPTAISRKPSVSTTTSRKGKWLEEEVKKLNALRDASTEWNGVAGQLPGRTSAACRRKWETLVKGKDQSMKKPESKFGQAKPETANEDEHAKGSSDEEMSESDIAEEKPKRVIEEERYSSSSDEDMSESGIENQEPESKVEEEEPERVMEDAKADISGGEDMSESASEEDPSESESDDEAEMKRKHVEFFLKR
jgi:hypothetical protein